MFRKADLVVLTKVDLLPYLSWVSVAAIRENLARVMPSARAIDVSATTGVGVTDFIAWVDETMSSLVRLSCGAGLLEWR